MRVLGSRGAVWGLYRCRRTIVDGRRSLRRSRGELKPFGRNEYRFISVAIEEGGTPALSSEGPGFRRCWRFCLGSEYDYGGDW